MSVFVTGVSKGTTGTEVKHVPSGVVIRTQAPRDNGGTGDDFSPTDLCVASVGACASTIMTLFASSCKLNISVEFEAEKIMASAPRRIAKINLKFLLKLAEAANGSEEKVTVETWKKIAEAGRNCPVRLSLSEKIEIFEIYSCPFGEIP